MSYLPMAVCNNIQVQASVTVQPIKAAATANPTKEDWNKLN